MLNSIATGSVPPPTSLPCNRGLQSDPNSNPTNPDPDPNPNPNPYPNAHPNQAAALCTARLDAAVTDQTASSSVSLLR